MMVILIINIPDDGYFDNKYYCVYPAQNTH